MQNLAVIPKTWLPVAQQALEQKTEFALTLSPGAYAIGKPLEPEALHAVLSRLLAPTEPELESV